MNYKKVSFAVTTLGLALASSVSATNGVNMIGIGPNSRALGGTGIAAPQDAVSAVFSNPAAMCISESCSSPQVDVSFTTFMPKVSAQAPNMMTGGLDKGRSDSDLYIIPAIGVSLPIGGEGSHWRAGFSMYGISGLGVDYTGTDLGNSMMIPFNYTELQIMKMAPSIAYSITPDISVGASAHFNYASLEVGKNPNMMMPNGQGGFVAPFAGMGKDEDSDWSYGIQIGTTWRVTDSITLGATYISAQKNTFEDVMPGQAGFEDFDLEAPQQAGIGAAWVGADERLTVSSDIKWLNWSDAAGYSDFGWDDQWTFGLGAQYELVEDAIFLRAGYNYGKSPVDSVDMATDLGGLIGFPAIMEHHLSLGVGFQFSADYVMNVTWVHGFENTVSSDSVQGLESTMYQDSVDVGLTWRF